MGYCLPYRDVLDYIASAVKVIALTESEKVMAEDGLTRVFPLHPLVPIELPPTHPSIWAVSIRNRRWTCHFDHYEARYIPWSGGMIEYKRRRGYVEGNLHFIES